MNGVPQDPQAPGWPDDPGIPGYEMVRPLGINGAAVYLVRQLKTGDLVVLMIWDSGWPRAGEHHQLDDAIARLQHPNIVYIIEVGDAPAGHFTVLEQLQGATTLSERLRVAPMAPAEAAHIAQSLVSAVEHARGQGMCLSRLRPADVTLTEAVVPKLFRVFARDTSPSTSAETDLYLVGTLLLAMVEGQPSTPASDALLAIAKRCIGEPSGRFASLTALGKGLATVKEPTHKSPSGPTRG